MAEDGLFPEEPEEHDQINNGFILLHRKMLDSQVWLNRPLREVWVWCLLKASWKEQWVSMKTGRGTTEVQVQAGQFVFGRKVASKELQMPTSSVQDRMKKLEVMGNIVSQPVSHYSIVTIANWHTYQDIKKHIRQPTRQASVNHPSTIRHIQEGEEGKEEEKKPPYPLFPDPLDNPEFQSVWKEWIAYRGRKLKPITAQKQLNKLGDWGSARAIAALEHTMFKGWQGIREPETAPTQDDQLDLAKLARDSRGPKSD